MTSVLQTPTTPPPPPQQRQQLPPLSPSSTSTPIRSPQSATSSSSFSTRSLQTNFFRSSSKSTDSIDTDIDRNHSSSIVDDCSQRTSRLFQSFPWTNMFNGRNSKSTSQLNFANCDKSNISCISFENDDLQSPHDQRLKGLTQFDCHQTFFFSSSLLKYYSLIRKFSSLHTI